MTNDAAMTGLAHNRLFDEARPRLRQGRDLEDVLRFLRARGCSVTESIRATMRLTDVSLADAKHTVHTSEAWSDLRNVHDKFHRMAADAIERDA